LTRTAWVQFLPSLTPKNQTYKSGPDDLCYTLVFFSTFEVLELPIKGPMEDAGVIDQAE
jgi:hypothetical protein